MDAMNASATATLTEGGALVASFGSGDAGGRTQAIARGQRSLASGAGQVRALRSRINRAGTTGRSAAARERRALLARLDAAAPRRAGGTPRLGALADIADALAAINSRRR